MPPSAPDPRRARLAYALFAGMVPCLALAWANGIFTYNQFYASGAYLRDAGWFSYTVFRQGILPSNPPLVEIVPHYFSFHLSLIVAVGSLLSYLFPGDRVSWYCVFQALVYAPLGVAIALLERSTKTLRSAGGAVTIAALGLGFAFNGEAIAAMGFPHFEILLASGICIMLGGLATDRPGVAWTGMALSIATREDGGAHAAMFLAAVLLCSLLGRPFPASRQRLLAMMTVALLSTAAMMVVQKKLFDAQPLLESEYLGSPIYSHLTRAALGARFRGLFDKALFVVLPFAIACVIAALDRDARWLLGWIFTLPWFALNFCAHQELKAEFGLYTSFPFIGAIFWLACYARVKYGPEAGLLRRYGRFAAVSIASSVGVIVSFPDAVRMQNYDMRLPADVDGAAIRAYAASLRANPALRSRLLVDSGMACWLLESLRGDAFRHGTANFDYSAYDAVTFFRTTQLGPPILNTIAKGGFAQCGALPRTAIVFCNRPGTALPNGFLPYPFLMSSLATSEHAHRAPDETIEVRATEHPELAVFGPFKALEAGHYRAAFRMRIAECHPSSDPHIEVDVFAANRTLGTGALDGPEGTVNIDFEVPERGVEAIELRTFTGHCSYAVESIRLDASDVPR